MASVVFPVEARQFVVNSDGINASTAIPAVTYSYQIGLTEPTLLVDYPISSASSYDWSSFPTAMVTKSSVVWQEALVKGNTAGRIASEIDHARQARDANLTFLAGAMVGLGGGAILSAIQEALHAS